MIENTKNFVSKEVIERVAKALGVDIAQRLESLDDLDLLQVFNYCMVEAYNEEERFFVDMYELVEFWEVCELRLYELAQAVAFGDGARCFAPDMWMRLDGYGHIETIDPTKRRAFMLMALCNLKEDFREDIRENLVQRALKDCGYLEE